MHHSHSRLLKSFFPLLIPSATYQHMRPLLREEPVGIYSLSLWCRNSGGIFQPFYSYRFSAYAALCNFPNGCTVSVIVFAGLFNLVYYSSTVKHCQVFSPFQFPAKKQLTKNSVCDIMWKHSEIKSCEAGRRLNWCWTNTIVQFIVIGWNTLVPMV